MKIILEHTISSDSVYCCDRILQSFCNYQIYQHNQERIGKRFVNQTNVYCSLFKDQENYPTELEYEYDKGYKKCAACLAAMEDSNSENCTIYKT